MIKEPHAEETVTGIQVTQPSVSKRIKVVAGWTSGGPARGVHSENLSQDNVLKLRLVCDQREQESQRQ